MRMRLQVKLAAILLVAGAGLGVGHAGATAANPASSQAHSPVDGINVLENRFFFRLYTRDPLEKRLERLELLVFGGTQAGSNEERIARLKKTVKDRDTASTVPPKPDAVDEQGTAAGEESNSPPPEAKTSPGGHGAGGPSTQYPVLNTLEWRALKKTYPKETIDQRLERLETKLFGAASPAMAYADRVERLKRTLGVGVAQNLPSGQSGPMGPMPKARARGGDLFEGLPAPGTVEPFGSGAPMSPFGMIPGFSDMFKQLQQQMEQLRQMPSGTWEWDSESNSWVDRRNGRHLKPGPGQTPQDILPSSPFPDQLSPFPVNPKIKKTPVIPPYDDPNSI
jgi:hypothetical protein